MRRSIVLVQMPLERVHPDVHAVALHVPAEQVVEEEPVMEEVEQVCPHFPPALPNASQRQTEAKEKSSHSLKNRKRRPGSVSKSNCSRKSTCNSLRRLHPCNLLPSLPRK